MSTQEMLSSKKKEETNVIGCTIRRKRLERGLTQEASAEEFGVSNHTWERWENGQTIMRAVYLLDVMHNWSISADEFYACDGACNKCSRFPLLERAPRSKNVVKLDSLADRKLHDKEFGLNY